MHKGPVPQTAQTLGAVPPVLGDCVMNTCFRDHMLTHIVGANIHQFNSIQRGTSQMGSARRMGRCAMEGVRIRRKLASEPV